MVLARRRSADRVRVVVGLGKRETQSGRVELGKSRKTHTHRRFVMPHHAVVSLVRRRRVQRRDKLNGTISSHGERRRPNSTSGVDIDKQVVARLSKYVLYNQNTCRSVMTVVSNLPAGRSVEASTRSMVTTASCDGATNTQVRSKTGSGV